MSTETRIKDFLKDQGVDVVGIAGPGRLAGGPPSLDLDYTMKGGRSIVSLAVPMDVPAIYHFLGKESPSPHNADQVHGNQLVHRVSGRLAEFIETLGHRAAVVPPNSSYRRSLDVFSTHPSFSHRFGAILSGVGAQGWSGNVMTKEHGASVYLGTVVTDAVLESDPMLPPRYFVDAYCMQCKLCARTCVAGMFEESEEDYILLNGELHPRGLRRNIDLCNASCFGLHSLSKDRKWSTWGRHWITDWVGRRPPAGRVETRIELLRKGGATGDATARFDVIRRTGKLLLDEEIVDELPLPGELPGDQAEADLLLRRFGERAGAWGRPIDPNVLTCGQCALVCGPTLKETSNRYEALIQGGIVVTGPGGIMVNMSGYEEAVEVRGKYPFKPARTELIKDRLASFFLWHRNYFGLEPRSVIEGYLYERRRRKAIRDYLTAADPSARR